MWSVVVVLPAVQAEFGVARADASLPYTLTMIGFGLGGVLMGRLADRFGIVVPRRRAAPSALGLGYVAGGQAHDLWQFTAGARPADRLSASSATFGPLIADISLWFDAPARHRGRDLRLRQLSRGHDLAAGRAAFHRDASAGAQTLSRHRRCSASSTMLPLALALRRRPPLAPTPRVEPHGGRASARPLGLSPAALQALLVHRRRRAAASRCRCRRCTSSRTAAIWATAPRAAREMLSLMLGFGIVSRLASGFDLRPHRRPAHAAARLGAAGARAAALPAVRRLASLYVISALFGLFQGGIVPATRSSSGSISRRGGRARGSASC